MPVLLADVVDHIAPPVLAEVDIDIRIFAAIRVREPLEQQAILHRAGVGEPEHIAHHGAHARATRVGRDALTPSPAHKVPHDQEVRRDVLVGENLQLALQPSSLGIRLDLGTPTLGVGFLFRFQTAHSESGCTQAVPPDEPGLRQHPQRDITLALGLRQQRLFRRVIQSRGHGKRHDLETRAVGVVPRRQIAGELRSVGPRERLLGRERHPHHRRVAHAQRQLDLPRAPLGDLHRVVARPDPDRPQLALEQLAHLRRALDIDLRRISHPVRIRLDLARRDADQRVVRVMVFLLQEVAVIVADQLKPHLVGELDQVRIDRVLLGDMVLQLDVEPLLAEHLRVPLRALNRFLPVLLVLAPLEREQMIPDLAPQVPVDRDEPRRVLRQKLPIDPRLEVEAREVRLRAQQHQIPPPLITLGQQHQVIPAVGRAGECPVAPRPTGRTDVGLNAQDRKHPLVLAGQVERRGPEQVPVIGHRDRVHPQFLDALHQLVDPVAAVKEGILRVQMQMHEPAGDGGLALGNGWRGGIRHWGLDPSTYEMWWSGHPETASALHQGRDSASLSC